MLCLNTLHEAECESSTKGTFLAYSYGNVGVWPCIDGTGGSCWAEIIFTSEQLYIPSTFKIRAVVELNGRCQTSGGVEASIAIFIEIKDLGISDRVYYVDAAEVSGGKREWNKEILYLWTPTHEISTPGYYAVKVRFRGEANTCCENTFASSKFNNRYGD